MKFRNAILAGAAAFALAACGQGGSAETSGATEAASAQQAAEEVQSDAVSGVYTPDSGHRYITFSYFHQGFSNPWLRWRDWDGELVWNAENPAESSVNVTIDVASIDSGVDEFDGHLVGENWFNAAAHPEITFVSTDVEKTGANTGKITGDLTIKGITKPVTLDVVFHKGAYQERGNSYKLGFSGKTTLMRSDFDLGAYVPVVSDEVDVVIETEWQMPAPASE
ncbi:MAG: YceI family protein [Oricola sp.]|jgi:polyisoprenoid-binding protein YceI|nr:YceI family protein [Oricola sp.]